MAATAASPLPALAVALAVVTDVLAVRAEEQEGGKGRGLPAEAAVSR
jgi:hypothetical protein